MRQAVSLGDRLIMMNRGEIIQDFQDEIEVFHSYCADRRRIGIDGFEARQFDHLMRYTPRDPGVEGLVTYTNLRAGLEVAQIQEQIAYFQALHQNFEWKVYEFDRPSNLQKLLESQSFVPGEMEVFMVLSLQGHGPIPKYENRLGISEWYATKKACGT